MSSDSSSHEKLSAHKPSPNKSSSPRSAPASNIVRDSSLGPAASLEPHSVPLTSAAAYQMDHTVKELESNLGTELNSTEGLRLLKSIASDVKAQGEILTAFIASQHEFKKQVTTEVSGIKKLLEMDHARYVVLA